MTILASAQLRSVGPRQPQTQMIEPYERYLQESVQAFTDLSGARLLREIRQDVVLARTLHNIDDLKGRQAPGSCHDPTRGERAHCAAAVSQTPWTATENQNGSTDR